tara:strand:+ start:733 stop:981 length:249 start_codon:yes stop_codon:yes gene_type:complete
MKKITTTSCLTAALLLAACSEEPGNEQIGAAPTTSEGADVTGEEVAPEEMPTPSAVPQIPSNVDIPETLVEIEDATEADVQD